MRRAPTEAEHKLWIELRARRLDGFKFTRQFAVAGYIADFACREAKLIVELDGVAHDVEADALRDRNLALAGYRVLRFHNRDVFMNLPAVLGAIAKGVAAPFPPPGPALARRLSAPLPGGEGE